MLDFVTGVLSYIMNYASQQKVKPIETASIIGLKDCRMGLIYFHCFLHKVYG